MRIKVSNLVATSDWSNYAYAVTGVEPSRPGLLTFVDTTRTTISLSWNSLVGSDTGGTDTQPLQIVNYNLFRDDGQGGNFMLESQLLGSANSFVVKYLRAGLKYNFKIQAVNSIGLSSANSTT